MNQALMDHMKHQRPTLALNGDWMLFRNPKVATISMMGEGPLRESYVRFRANQTKWLKVWDGLYRDRLDEVFKFTFVRNSWDRVASAFFFLLTRHVKKNRPKMKDGDGELFGKFIKGEFRHDWPNVNVHYRDQGSNFLFDGEVFVDFIGEFEHLVGDWGYVAGKLGVCKELPHVNKGPKRKGYVEYYDSESVEIVGDIYREEIDYMGYEFGK